MPAERTAEGGRRLLRFGERVAAALESRRPLSDGLGLGRQVLRPGIVHPEQDSDRQGKIPAQRLVGVRRAGETVGHRLFRAR
jgi:hypothetical protein